MTSAEFKTKGPEERKDTVLILSWMLFLLLILVLVLLSIIEYGLWPVINVVLGLSTLSLFMISSWDTTKQFATGLLYGSGLKISSTFCCLCVTSIYFMFIICKAITWNLDKKERIICLAVFATEYVLNLARKLVSYSEPNGRRLLVISASVFSIIAIAMGINVVYGRNEFITIGAYILCGLISKLMSPSIEELTPIEQEDCEVFPAALSFLLIAAALVGATKYGFISSLTKAATSTIIE